MSIEAMKQALEALEEFKLYPETPEYFKRSQSITSLRQAIAEADKQEPVAHFGSAYVNENGVHITTVLGPVAIPQDAKLYTRPQPKREPLTDEQIEQIWGNTPMMLNAHNNRTRIIFARAIEAAHGIKAD
jgi:hypothetical protein